VDTPSGDHHPPRRIGFASRHAAKPSSRNYNFITSALLRFRTVSIEIIDASPSGSTITVNVTSLWPWTPDSVILRPSRASHMVNVDMTQFDPPPLHDDVCFIRENRPIARRRMEIEISHS